MESIEQMIKRLCPKGVEWKKICEICMNCDSKRKPVTSGKRVAGKYPYYGASGIVDYVEDYIFDGDYLLVSEDGANLLARRTPIAFSISGKNWVNNHAHVLQFDNYIERKYIEYYLNMIDLRKYISGGAQPKLSQQSLNNIFVPVPPLEIQSRIVEVLDKMTTLTAELEAELKAELEARKQQYEYYRNQLLTRFAPNQPVTEYSLGELFVFKNGLNASKEQFGHGTPIVNYVNVYKKCSIVSDDLQGRVELDNKSIERYRVQRGDVFFTRTSETQDEIGIASVLLEDIEDCVFSGFILRARPLTNILLPEYCKYCFSTNIVRRQIIRLSTMTTRALTNGTSLSEVKILVPPLAEQQRIVSILDRFEALTTDLQSGLSAEIEARRQQYEYYRNKLLTFEAV